MSYVFMKLELTSTEIAEKYNVTTRTAFRWKAANDSRCFIEVEDENPEERKKREPTESVRAILDKLSDLNTQLAVIGYFGDLPPKMVEKRHALYKAIDDLQRESDLYPASHWEE